jgi:plastocyanin
MARMLQFILTLFWLPVINAQYGGGQSSSTTTAPSSTSPSGTAAVQSVSVGEHGLTFSPDTLTVSPGDKVEFHFYPGGPHSVTQSSFANPCHPLNDTSIFSGFVPATSGESVRLADFILEWKIC